VSPVFNLVNSQVILLGLALELPASFTLFFFKDEHALSEESDALHTHVCMRGLDPCIIQDAHWDEAASAIGLKQNTHPDAYCRVVGVCIAGIWLVTHVNAHFLPAACSNLPVEQFPGIDRDHFITQ
jgi:hypothetical protein